MVYTFFEACSTGLFLDHDYNNGRIDTEHKGHPITGEEQRRRIAAMHGTEVSGEELKTRCTLAGCP